MKEIVERVGDGFATEYRGHDLSVYLQGLVDRWVYLQGLVDRRASGGWSATWMTFGLQRWPAMV